MFGLKVIIFSGLGIFYGGVNRVRGPLLSQISWRTGSWLSWSRRWRQSGRSWSIREMKRVLWVGSRRWASSWTTMYSRHSLGLRARSVFRRMADTCSGTARQASYGEVGGGDRAAVSDRRRFCPESFAAY